LPDMSAFASVKANPGYQKLPSGLIIQWGSAVTGADGSIFATYPTTFPNQVLASFCTNLGEFPTGPVAASTPSLVSIRLSCIANSSGTGAPGVSVSYFVVGY
ncbi:gp53-like domain-containing protein, partial [Salmonella enterica subsp. enterica serovar Montevideo]